MADANREKQAAAEEAAKRVEDGMTVGLGTGSTAAKFLDALVPRLAGGLSIAGVPTSEATARHALRLGIELIELDHPDGIDLAVDGADETDETLGMIKGGGGALLREKIVLSSARRRVIIVDSSKLVAGLGAFPLPVEITPFGHLRTLRRLAATGADAALRRAADGAPFVSDGGNYIADCGYGAIGDPAALEAELAAIPGVVETGLFLGLVDELIIGEGARTRVLRPAAGATRA
jgi:ribose 5-phosphate isomerase A